MITLLTLDEVACSTPDGAPLFAGLTMSLDRGIVGLVGRNGAGKTSLLEAIAGLRPVTAGTIVSHGRIGLLRQQISECALTVTDLLGVAPDVARLDRIERGVATNEDHDTVDWTLPSRLDAVLTSTGLTALDPQRRVETLSGGQRTRVMIAALLLTEPDILLLDEPTNNLDDVGREAIKDLLAGWPGAALVASHDRDLLRSANRIVELTSVGVHMVGGGWDAFAAEREAARSRAEEAMTRTEAELKQARRERQRETEKQVRRDKRGRAAAAKGIDPRVFLHRQQQRAEKSRCALSLGRRRTDRSRGGGQGHRARSRRAPDTGPDRSAGKRAVVPTRPGRGARRRLREIGKAPLRTAGSDHQRARADLSHWSQRVRQDQPDPSDPRT